MYLLADGPSVHGQLNISTSAAELKVGASALDERKILLIQSLGNSIYIGFDNTVTSGTGVEIRARQTMIIEAGPSVTVYAIASSGTIDVRIMEFG